MNFPSAALVVMQTRWPALLQAFQQGHHAGMREVKKLAQDASKAAGLPSNMRSLVYDYIMGKLQDQKQPTREARAQQIVNTLLEADFHSDSEKQALQQPHSKPLERQIGTITPEQFARGDAYWTGRRKQGHRRYPSAAIKPLK